MEYVSTDGTIVAHYEYSPFGETVIQSGELADAFSFRFSTKYWEKEIGLYYYGYRFYVPGVGRWLNRDPMEEDGGVNLYGHARNSSINQIDSLGLKCTINVLFGHGASEDVPGNWLLSESFRLFPELDDDDRITLLGCVSTQVSILLFQKLYKEAGSTEEALENTLKLMRQKFINSGVDYTVNNVDTMGPAWNKLAISVVAETHALCDNGCCEVFIKWTAQEGDKQIDKIKAFLLRMHAKMLKDSEAGYKTVYPFLGAKEPGGEDFFGKTFRWSCEHKYFEVLNEEKK